MYQYAEDFNNAAGFDVIEPQPQSKGIQPGRVTEALDGSEFNDGFARIDLIYSAIDKEQFDDLLTLFGLSATVRTKQCTVSIPEDDNERAFASYNGIIHYPELPREGSYEYWWANVVFKVKRLEKIV